MTFCAEHARRNAMALKAQIRKSSTGSSPEALLSQLSEYNRPGTHSTEGGRSETSHVLGKWLYCDGKIFYQLQTEVSLFLHYSMVLELI